MPMNEKTVSLRAQSLPNRCPDGEVLNRIAVVMERVAVNITGNEISAAGAIDLRVAT